MNKFTTEISGRINKVLAQELDVSRNEVEKLVKDGLVSLNGKSITKTSTKVQEGDEIAYVSLSPRPLNPLNPTSPETAWIVSP
jgi:23S rRNA pseudouridine1911/1915/1917 synthase